MVPPGASTVDASELVRLGLWRRAPTGLDAMLESPRYFPGRRVLVRATVCPRPAADAYMCLEGGRTARREGKRRGRGREGKAGGGGGGREFTTHRAVVVSCAGGVDGSVAVAIDCAGGGTQTIVVSACEVARLNHPHQLPFAVGGAELRLEDGIRCNYCSPLAKASPTSVFLARAPSHIRPPTHPPFFARSVCPIRRTTGKALRDCPCAALHRWPPRFRQW